METQTHTLAKRIVAKEISKQEALTKFEGLPQKERDDLVSSLRESLLDVMAATDSRSPTYNGSGCLKALDQRDLQPVHEEYIAKLTKAYEAFVPKSKKNAVLHQKYFVDQRRPFHLIKPIKELHFQITYSTAKGAYVHDVDGNRYIDLSGDMGVNIFGHNPEFVNTAIKKALDECVPLLGYSEMIFKTAKLFSELTGHERTLFTQSGTEAVMWAVRIARAATQKKKLVIFEGAYHGLSDAVCAMKDESGMSFSVGPGMLQDYADHIIVLDYGDLEQLKVIEHRADEIAGVLVEPVQSRHPYTQPTEFLQQLRKVTLASNIVLLFDEMITGFRICPRGAQGYFGVKADIATYGKIPGGGMPTGVIAGSAKYMDLIDGGSWQFGDESMPKPRRTPMAGTHSQNPVKIASAFAVLTKIKDKCGGRGDCSTCNCFQKTLNQKTDQMVSTLNEMFEARKLPLMVDNYGSLFRFRFTDSYWGITEALFYVLLRMNGVETSVQGNCFLTTAHSDKDIEAIIQAVDKSITTLIENSFFYKPDPEQLQPDEYLSAAGPVADSPIESNRAPKAESKINAENRSLQELKKLILKDLQQLGSTRG